MSSRSYSASTAKPGRASSASTFTTTTKPSPTDSSRAHSPHLFSGDHPDSSVRSVVTHVRDRPEESETLRQQAQSNSLAQFSASPDLHNEFLSAVIGAMDSSTDLSAQILNNPDLSQKLLRRPLARAGSHLPTLRTSGACLITAAGDSPVGRSGYSELA
jgi:hypothetical protein